MAKVGIIGSGNVGANIAFFAAERNVGDVTLYDVKEGLATGKALDMMEAASVRNYQTKLSGTDSLEDILDSDVIVIAAGEIRKPGMRREDLYDSNSAMILDIAPSLKSVDASIIVVSEPVDYLTTLLLKETSLAASRVIGLGGFLDSTRLRYLLADELGVSAETVAAVVIGTHSDNMIPLTDYCKVSGIPVNTLINADRLEVLYGNMAGAGDEIVELAGRASSYYGPAAAVSDLCGAIIGDTGRIVPVSLMFTGQYGIEGVAMSLPAIIGRQGITRVLEPKLDESQKELLEQSARDIRDVVQARRSS